MKLSFCPQKILLIRPLAKSFPVMGYGVGAHCMVVVENMVVEPGLKYLNMYVRCCYLFCVHQVHVYKPTSFTSSMDT